MTANPFDHIMANRFQELDAKHAEIEAALDDPDAVGTPAEFLADVERLHREAYAIAQELTVEDFESEYTTDEGEEDVNREPEFAQR